MWTQLQIMMKVYLSNKVIKNLDKMKDEIEDVITNLSLAYKDIWRLLLMAMSKKPVEREEVRDLAFRVAACGLVLKRAENYTMEVLKELDMA